MHPVAYAREFAATAGPKPITSPFGAWLLPAASGIYGEDVRHLAGQLLTSAPEPVATALAYWGLLPAHVIPAYAATGPIPPQAVADEWTREKTLGMIDRFPGDVTGTVSVIASAIACTLDWTVPLDKVGSDLLGGEFGARLSSAMTTTATHDVRIYRTRTAGLVCAVRMADSRGVNVTSVLASPDVSAADTQQAARNIVNGSAEHIRLDRPPQRFAQRFRRQNRHRHKGLGHRDPPRVGSHVILRRRCSARDDRPRERSRRQRSSPAVGLRKVRTDRLQGGGRHRDADARRGHAQHRPRSHRPVQPALRCRRVRC